MAKSNVEIYNLALTILGGNLLQTTEAGWETATRAAQLCTTNFPHILDKSLAAHDWSFATRSELLAQRAESGRGLYPNRFALPGDFLRAIKVEGGGSLMQEGPNYVLEADDLLTAEPRVSLLYVAQLTDPRRFPPIFVDALAYGLAALLATAINNDQRIAQAHDQKYVVILQQAWAQDLQHQNPVERPSEWVMARNGTNLGGW